MAKIIFHSFLHSQHTYYGIFHSAFRKEQQEFYNEHDTDIEFHSKDNDSVLNEDSYYSNDTDTMSNEHFTMVTTDQYETAPTLISMHPCALPTVRRKWSGSLVFIICWHVYKLFMVVNAA